MATNPLPPPKNGKTYSKQELIDYGVLKESNTRQVQRPRVSKPRTAPVVKLTREQEIALEIAQRDRELADCADCG